MFVDINIRPARPEHLRPILNQAARFNYRLVAVEGLSGESLMDLDISIRVVPRFTYSDLRSLSRGREPRNHLIAYELCDTSAIKALDKLRSRVNVLKLTNKALSNIKRRHLRLLKNCRIPIEISLNDAMIDGRLDHGFLIGFGKLVPYIEAGHIDLILSSGAGNQYELLHPLTAIAVLKELGLSYLTALKALTTSPSRLLEGSRAWI
mgnify:CR=1 FL=1